MKKEVKIFIARTFFEHPLNFRRTVEEGIFHSYKTALKWLKETCFTEEDYSVGYTSEIIEFRINKKGESTKERKTCFNHFGRKLPEDPAQLKADPKFVPKYAKGDLVKFQTLSLSFLGWKDSIGVIAGVPLSAAERRSRFGKNRN